MRRLLSLNTNDIISVRTGFVKQNLSGNDIFCDAGVTLQLFRDARLPYDSGLKQGRQTALGFTPSLRSIRAAHDASALLVTLRALRDGV